MWTSETRVVNPPYILVNSGNGQRIIPAADFRGIQRSADVYSVFVKTYGTGGEYVEEYSITKSEYDSIARQLGFVVEADDDQV